MIVARNWRCKRGELDVVACKDGVLVVCEVKARASNAFGRSRPIAAAGLLGLWVAPVQGR